MGKLNCNGKMKGFPGAFKEVASQMPKEITVGKTYRKPPVVQSTKLLRSTLLYADGEPTGQERVIFRRATDQCAKWLEKSYPGYICAQGQECKALYKNKFVRRARKSGAKITKEMVKEYYESLREDESHFYLFEAERTALDISYERAFYELEDECSFIEEEESARDADYQQVLAYELAAQDHERNMAMGLMCYCDYCRAIREDYYAYLDQEHWDDSFTPDF